MRRLVFITELSSIEETIKKYEQYSLDMIRKNTKRFYSKAGYFYVTKFSPDARAYEEYIQLNINPFIHTTTKEQLSYMVELLPGLNLFEGRDYQVVLDDKDQIIGLVFSPMDEESIAEVLKFEQAGVGEEDTFIGI